MATSDVVVKEERIKTNDLKEELYCKSWKPNARTPIGVVTFIHGLGEHCSRYDSIFELFAQRGLIVNAFDQRGHGRSSGTRGHSPNFETIFSDIDLFARQADSHLPHIVYGHSLGGELALAWSLDRSTKSLFRIDGVVSTSPLIRLTHPPSSFVVSLGRLVSRITPSLTISNGLKLNDLSRDPTEVQKYKSDPLVHASVSLALSSSFLEEAEKLLLEAQNFKLPLLMIHGSADQITSRKGTEEFFEKASSADKTLKIFEGLYHECHNELPEDRQLVIQTILEWIVGHCEENVRTPNSESHPIEMSESAKDDQ